MRAWRTWGVHVDVCVACSCCGVCGRRRGAATRGASFCACCQKRVHQTRARVYFLIAARVCLHNEPLTTKHPRPSNHHEEGRRQGETTREQARTQTPLPTQNTNTDSPQPPDHTKRCDQQPTRDRERERGRKRRHHRWQRRREVFVDIEQLRLCWLVKMLNDMRKPQG